MTDENKRVCFVIAPIGEPESDTRRRSDQVMKHIIRPVVVPMGYRAIRADEMDKPGIITSQVITQVVEADLVIADLTERNPNVFYELALRHAISKPFVQIIKKGEALPFDVAGTRTVSVDLHDLDSVEDAKKQIGNQIQSLEADSSDLETPISVSLDLQQLRQSEDPEQRSFADVLSALSEVRGGLSTLGDINAKFDETISTIQAHPLLAKHRDTYVESRYTHYIARESESVFGFIILLSTLCERTPWLYEVGMEAQRAAADGDSEKAREVFGELVRLIDLSNNIQRVVPSGIKEELSTLFEQTIRCYEQGHMNDLLPW